MLRIALPNKGRLSEDTRTLFNDAGLEVRSSGERALRAALGDEFEAIFVRAQDIPEFVADGAADAGVTGWDLVSESERPLTSLLDLGFGKCRLVVAARDDAGISNIDQIGSPSQPARVATVFPRITARYFAERGRPVEIVPVSGAAEIAPHLGIADIVVDLTSTGSTLRVNGLREMDTVMVSTAHLITVQGGPRQGDPARAQELDELVTALSSVIRARSQRYLMANVPRVALDDVRAVLPGLNGPTVIEIADNGPFVAVHAVVKADTSYRTIAQLRALGAEGILVTRIERLVP
ncbi:MAG: ATP phosphoribosyltransferase [Gemmatimonadaceae bacterium]|nr:ATP phosphoribosyltransferase [Gemmatimonadaceae bacterium]